MFQICVGTGLRDRSESVTRSFLPAHVLSTRGWGLCLPQLGSAPPPTQSLRVSAGLLLASAYSQRLR